MSSRILKYELKKIHPVLFAALFLFLCFHMYDMYRSDFKKNIDEEIYRDYIEKLSRIEADETTDFLAEEREENSAVIALEDENRKEYSFGRLSFDEFHETNVKIEKAKKKAKVIDDLYARSVFFDEQREAGRECEFFYDYDVSRFLDAYSDKDILFIFWFAFAAFLLGVGDSLYQSTDLIKISKKGGVPVVMMRLFLLFLLTAGFWLISFLISFIMYEIKGFSEFNDISVCSLRQFASYPDYISIKIYMLLACARRILYCMVVSIVILPAAVAAPGRFLSSFSKKVQKIK